MKVKITRKYLSKTCIVGDFEVLDDEDKVLYKCFSLEEDKEGLESGKDLRVPPGDYNLKRYVDSSFNTKGRKEVGGVKVLNDDDSIINICNDDVPFERHILIHWGNTDKDTLGCILLGLSKSEDNTSVGRSRLACKRFYDLMYGKDLSAIPLEIVNEF